MAALPDKIKEHGTAGLASASPAPRPVSYRLAGRSRSGNKRTRRLAAYGLLMLADSAAIALAFLTSNLLYHGDLFAFHGVTLSAVMIPLFLGAAFLKNVYSAKALTDTRAGIASSLQAFAAATAAILFMVYFLKAGADFSRITMAHGIVAAPLLIVAMRCFAEPALRAITGRNPLAVAVIDDIGGYEARDGETVLSPGALGFDPAGSDPAAFHLLAEAQADADRIIVRCPPARNILWATILRSMARRGEIVAATADPLGILAFDRFAGERTMVVATGPLSLADRALKRMFDLALALPVLLVLLPVLGAAALAIRIESRGPALFVQDRIGRDNRIFRMLKFRSMYTERCDADASKLTTREDERVTRVGRVIRRTSLDELPQLLNVVTGDMSIVGPRPHALTAKAADRLYWDVDARYRHRHAIKPGLTGLAQVRGHRGSTDRAEDLTNRLHSDLEYLADWSIWKDLLIVAQTFRVLIHDQAY